MPSFRLHWFFPSRRTPSDDDGVPHYDPQRLRRLLARIGPTWAASPLRRIIQAACFLLFLGLLFYVCWPYEAMPASVWHGWIPLEVDTVTGRVTLTSDTSSAKSLPPNTRVYVVDAENQSSILFQVVGSKGTELTLVPTETLNSATLERLSASFGPWSLHADEPQRWPSHYADDLASKQRVPAWTFLVLDPLVSLSTALAARSWIWSLSWAAAIMLICLAIPRGFCGYVCPMGTLIDLVDWGLGRRVSRIQLSRNGWWARLRYTILAAVLFAALGGVVLTGFVAAMPLLTRGLVFLVAPLQTGLIQGWHHVPPMHIEQWISVGMFLTVWGLSLLGPRFWCRFICPTGAVFSLGSLLRLHQRQVGKGCVKCGRCVAYCPFDAVDSDFATRTGDCAFCQTCAGICPTEAITFGLRHQTTLPSTKDESSPLVRRDFLVTAINLAAGGLGGFGLVAVTRRSSPGPSPEQSPPLRPPGSVPEEDFVRRCVRCGECLRVCPNDVLQPLGVSLGLDRLWTPYVAADWAGCEPSCNRCGQVCPTGAIRALSLEEKRVARIGLAVIDRQACLPYVGRSACQLCVDACTGTGHQAIDFILVDTQLDATGQPIADTGFLAPVVQPEKCVGCGQCQSRCYAINVQEKRLLTRSAIHVEARKGKEDRLQNGSDRALRQAVTGRVNFGHGRAR